jgi:hypothetical protein
MFAPICLALCSNVRTCPPGGNAIAWLLGTPKI